MGMQPENIKPENLQAKKVKVRSKLIERDGDMCFYCRWVSPTQAYTIDHYIPIQLGGTDYLHNLRLACSQCNGEKNNYTVGEWYKRVQTQVNKQKLRLEKDRKLARRLLSISKKDPGEPML